MTYTGSAMFAFTYVVTLSEMLTFYILAGLFVTVLIFLVLWGIGELVIKIRNKFDDIYKKVMKW